MPQTMMANAFRTLWFFNLLVTITRGTLQALQQLLEEAFGGTSITPCLHQYVERDAMLVHRAPQIMKFS